MQQAIPYSAGRTWGPLPSSATSSGGHAVITDRPSLDGPSSSSSSHYSEIRTLVEENPVLVVGRRGCCMCHVVKRLLLGLGVNPTVCEVGDDTEETALMDELMSDMASSGTGSGGGAQQQFLFPAVFIGGRLVGGLDRLMAVHISGDLVPILKDAGALWL